MELDSIDKKILSILQEDVSLSIHEIGDRVGLSVNPCWRRIKNMEKSGVIERKVAILNEALIGLGVTTYVFIRTKCHDQKWLDGFAAAVTEIPEIIECHRMSGSVDYLLKCVVRDIDHYDRVYKRLISKVSDLTDVSSAFSMEKLKSLTKFDSSMF